MFGWLFGNSKAANKAVDGIYDGLDALVFTDEEIKQLVPHSDLHEESAGVTFPIRTYNEFIEQAGLKSINRRDLTERVEPFFKIPKIAERIMKKIDHPSFPEFQMGMQFIDYVVGKQ